MAAPEGPVTEFARWLERENLRLHGHDRHTIQRVQAMLAEYVPFTAQLSWVGRPRLVAAQYEERISELEEQLRGTQSALEAVSKGAQYTPPRDWS
jgi:hypothetical protein